MQNILLTGSTGFLGKSLLPVLERDYRVFSPSHTDLDITDQQNVEEFIEAVSPDIIIHLAAIASPSNPAEHDQFLNVNVGGTYNLLKYATAGCRFIFASSIVVGGTQSYDGVKRGESWRHNPTNLYALAKANAENCVTTFTNLGKVNGISLRFCAICGNYKKLTHGAIKDLVHKAKASGDTIEIWGKKPGSHKPYLWIDDAINAITAAIEHEKVSGPINITNKDEIWTNELVDIILEYYGAQKEKVWSGKNTEGDNKRLHYKNVAALKNLSWAPQFNSREVIKKCLS